MEHSSESRAPLCLQITGSFNEFRLYCQLRGCDGFGTIPGGELLQEKEREGRRRKREKNEGEKKREVGK